MGEEPGPEGVGLGADAGMGVHEVLAGRSSSPPRTGGGGYPGRGGTHTGEGRRGSIGDWARGSTGGAATDTPQCASVTSSAAAVLAGAGGGGPKP